MILLTDNGPVNFEVLDRIEERRLASPEVREQMDRDAGEGQLLTDQGEPLDPATEKRVRTRLLDRYGHIPPAPTFAEYGRAARDTPRWLIPDLWPWDTIPMLSGNHKAGKTTVVADLVASLVVPGRKFLDRFGPADWGGEEPDVFLINAETPEQAMLDALYTAGVEDDSHLVVNDLEVSGGAHRFDVTVPENYDFWGERLVYCVSCDGSDDSPPGVVIVDGMTAILGGSTDRYAEWYAAFRRLMREVGVPHALCTGHTTMSGTHSMGGVEALGGPDGLWTYASMDPDNPTSRRYFQVQPRLGGAVVPRTEVQMVEGRLTAAAESSSPESTPHEVETIDRCAEVLQRLTDAGPEGLTSSELTGGGEEGQSRRKARDELAHEGLIVSRREGRRTLWSLPEQ